MGLEGLKPWLQSPPGLFSAFSSLNVSDPAEDYAHPSSDRIVTTLSVSVYEDVAAGLIPHVRATIHYSIDKGSSVFMADSSLRSLRHDTALLYGLRNVRLSTGLSTSLTTPLYSVNLIYTYTLCQDVRRNRVSCVGPA